MAKTSLLDPAGPITGAETVPIVQGGRMVQANMADYGAALTAPAVAEVAGMRDETLAAVDLVGRDTRNPNVLGALGGLDANDNFSRRVAGYYSIRDQAWVSRDHVSAMLAEQRYVTDMAGHSQPGGSGVVSAGAAVKSTSGIAGSPGRHLEWLLQQYNPEHIVVNRGVSGQRSTAIAARVGAIPMLITLTAGTIVAPGAVVACTASPGADGPSAQRANAPDVYTGYIGNQLCLLKAVDNASANPKQYTIEQVAGTADLTVIPATPFHLKDRSLDYAIKCFWATQNDPDVQTSLNMIGAMVEALPQKERRFWLLGDWTFCDGTQDIGTAVYNNRIAKNLALMNQYGPRRFIDVQSLLSGLAPYDGSIYPSLAQFAGEIPDSSYDWSGVSYLALGRPPRRWMSLHKGGSDLNHFHEDTNFWLMKWAVEFIYKPRGWLL